MLASRPELGAFAALFYCRQSVYRFRGADGVLHRLLADEGVEQGDSLAPALFAYGLRPALARAQDELDARCRDLGVEPVVVLAYFDDIVLLAPPEVADFAVEVVQVALQEVCGLELTRGKTRA